MERLTVIAALLTIAGCASSPTPTHVAGQAEPAKPSEPDPYADQLSKQTDNPQMIAYIKESAMLPQPERALRGNELIRNNKLLVFCLFDSEHQADEELQKTIKPLVRTNEGCKDDDSAHAK